jgi:hypothetical protein
MQIYPRRGGVQLPKNKGRAKSRHNTGLNTRHARDNANTKGTIKPPYRSAAPVNPSDPEEIMQTLTGLQGGVTLTLLLRGTNEELVEALVGLKLMSRAVFDGRQVEKLNNAFQHSNSITFTTTEKFKASDFEHLLGLIKKVSIVELTKTRPPRAINRVTPLVP